MNKLLVGLALGAGFVLLKNTKASKKSTSLEARYGDNFHGVWTEINTLSSQLSTLSTDFFSFQSSLSGLVGNASFLANLSELPNQSDNNTTLTGVENFCNNLSDNLQANGFMH